MSARPIDADAREAALDPTRSFIVQAPAGSGKTELLTRRVLTLLATVERPEDIVAITFTRKAAAEMRHRVVEALRAADAPGEPDDAYAQEGLAIARAALARDREFGWGLLEDPSRLLLRTIDAFASQLARGLPVLSALGGGAAVIDDARGAYRDAADRFLDESLDSIGGVSRRLDNRLVLLRDRLAALLAVRDQWQGYVGDDFTDVRLRDVLEGMLAALVARRLDAARASAPPGLGASLQPILERCVAHLRMLDELGDLPNGLEPRHHAVIALHDALIASDGRLPGSEADDLAGWRALGQFLLTTSGSWRKKLDKHTGFPAATAHKTLGVAKAELEGHKADGMTLLRTLDGESAFQDALCDALTLPEPRYRDADWALLGELGGGLRQLLAQLQVTFALRGELDFVEIAQRALQALGDESAPTDLALALDLRLKHLLVDEFQDTSHAQFALFERLVGGWEASDGRTFFAVGDPMQSIYRFRQGDVGLFLRAVDEGVGPVPLEALRLEVNFRSVAGVIDWVNDGFATAFPALADRDIGAVTYERSSPFAAVHPDDDKAVAVHLVDHDVDAVSKLAAEAERVAELVTAALEEDADGTVGVLLRARTHAPAITAALAARGVPYRAVEIDRLGERPVVRDLVALALALRYPHDRISWLALLRGPLCGLALSDLYALCAGSDGERDGERGHEAIIELCADAERLMSLSDDGRARVEQFAAELRPAVHAAAREPITPWIDAVWLRLGGPAICRDAIELSAAERALMRLGELERDHGLWQRASIERAMHDLFAAESPDPEAARVQIMTLHKSKGLEFDTVVLPALATGGGRDDARLLDWYEFGGDGRKSLLLAPIDAPHTPRDAKSEIGALLRGFRRRADEVERVRLLYVACTRARRKLHLVATLARDDAGEFRAPAKQTLLAPLWPVLSAGLARAHDDDGDAPADSLDAESTDDAPQTDLASSTERRAPPLERTISGWRLPPFERFEWTHAPPEKTDVAAIDYDWSGSTARDVGTLVHRAFERLANASDAERTRPDSEAISRLARELRTLGVGDSQLDEATGLVVRAINNTLDDERGRWLFDDGHESARCEWALSLPTLDDGRVVAVERVIIDRTFIDASGARWIVDYKTGSHEGGGLDAFLDREVERYSAQLTRYADVMRRIEPERDVRVGLWFPMVRGWRELV